MCIIFLMTWFYFKIQTHAHTHAYSSPEARNRILWCKIIKRHFLWLICFSSSLGRTDASTQSCLESIRNYWFSKKGRESAIERRRERKVEIWRRHQDEDKQRETKSAAIKLSCPISNWKMPSERARLTFFITVVKCADKFGRSLRSAV